MKALLRRLLRYPSFTITPADAERIAAERARKEGWPWIGPVVIRETLREYTFLTNAHSRGGNVSIDVDGVSGRVTRATITSR